MTTKTKTKRARVNIHTTFNNTIITVNDMEGKTICWASAGGCGFKGARKQTAYAATVTAERAAKKAKELGVEEVEVFIKGPGAGRDAALRALRAAGLQLVLIADVTPIPHNGPRKKKKRRGA
ncbi:30S ribosomal protein S11 [Candidatus Shapirobacteria bacterium]|nr:30S ribosomal protein S11 [Candidatus Shapirobacteria bacterium]